MEWDINFCMDGPWLCRAELSISFFTLARAPIYLEEFVQIRSYRDYDSTGGTVWNDVHAFLELRSVHADDGPSRRMFHCLGESHTFVLPVHTNMLFSSFFLLSLLDLRSECFWKRRMARLLCVEV